MKKVWIAALATLFTCGMCWCLATGCERSSAHGSSDADTPTGPYLSALTVSGPTSVTLVPPFSPRIYDYYVRCSAGANALTVSMTASPGAESALLQPKTSASQPAQTLALSVDENQAIVASASDGTKAEAYWVRCLPHDFPGLQMNLHPEAGTPTPGYYLIGNTSVPSGEGGYPMVLDGNGVPVWYYLEPHRAGVYDVDNIVSGAISFIPAPAWNPFEIHQLTPLDTTYASANGEPSDEHELRALPNGDYLLIQTPVQTGIDLTGLTLPLADGGSQSFGPNGNIVACNIQEVGPSGNVVWQWMATDHFDPVQDDTYLYPAETEADGAPLVEPFHCNSIEVDAIGNLLVSARNMDSIFYVERATGKVLWKMGGATYSKDNATYVPALDPFYRQHDARFPNGWKSSCSGAGGNGQISLFDDETAEPGPARAMVYDVNVVAADCTSSGDGGVSGATVAWQYKGQVSIPATGSFRILADGSRVIGWGTSTGGFVFSEVNLQGNDLLDFYFTDYSQSYRAIKVPLTAFDLNVLRSTAGTPGPSVSKPTPPEGGIQPDEGGDGSEDGGDGSSDGIDGDAGGGPGDGTG